ncbi:cadherin repeat domain-containing protein [Candidatus Pacearchaeota archaeon]|nr:cadherin repeat domain-containing protein [Candidatus Pacearchaeota archaeon]
MLIYSSSFVPNTTINAVKGINRLVVFARNDSETKNKSVVFNVSVANFAPILQNMSNLFVCEDRSLSVFFNATDVDYDPISFLLSPNNPFFAEFRRFDGSASIGELFSIVLRKAHARGNRVYEETLFAIDDDNFVDSKQFNITVIEVNHAPVLQNLGTTTAGINETFYIQINATDLEDGTNADGRLRFNLTFLSGIPFFKINETFGIINVTPNDTHRGTYNIEVCVNDSGIAGHPNLTNVCGETNASKYNCILWQLTVTNINRPPNITDWWNSKTNNRRLNITIQELENILFNISVIDPDGTIPDNYWYLDGRGVHFNRSNTDSFFYPTNIGDAGKHILLIQATDGLLNDSRQWNITILPTFVPPPSVGGAGGKLECIPKWGCEDWSVCQNANLAKQVEDIFYGCVLQRIGEEYCGFQLRKCIDVNSCNVTRNRPAEIQSCLYSEDPQCFDGIRNCHSGRCEILVDCGGPCKPCATCSDGIKNQNEQGIDCGGPCPFKCPEIEKPERIRFLGLIIWLALFLIIIMIVVLFYIVWRIQKMKERYKYAIKKWVR